MSPELICSDARTLPPLDESLYTLGTDELAFFKDQTRITGNEELKGHIIGVQKKAYKLYGYQCIRRFGFVRLKISRQPIYQRVLQLSKERPGALLLDIGCCFGNDIRKAVSDGWPVQHALASDLRTGFWEYGHELFRSTPETFPAAFIAGDAFDPAMILPREPFYIDSPPIHPRPTELHSLISLNPLQGHITAIHASSFFHLFDGNKQSELARQMATLLSTETGSVIFGSHNGQPTKGYRPDPLNFRGYNQFCHSPDSWRDLWDGQIFKKGSVRVEAELLEDERADLAAADGVIFYLLKWSVTRL
ncbi:hypothetical protein P691DRAFT_708864 [Macrolepiota fuliginosa MF-IS2]|uniref:Methyltransferase ausD n=1 Tax=Macrolepiota fuliginosa MF-IS2 TaxID=1400762 RepID=A0A9P5X8Z8_9AGAR|nr:hypothetical protein P691DRAFT_708864 [Macrolepiota fuliginosa MF-IS2]